MSTLTLVERRTLDKFLQMASGYVLDFSNRTFQEFVLENTGLDIDSEEIGSVGSKAQRLRHFWTKQPDHVVGKLLKGLIDYVETDSPLREQARIIAHRLLPGHRVTTEKDHARIWSPKRYRLFLSHKAEVKSETGALKNGLDQFGISAFVAHADVKPTREWQGEIENALASMDAFTALLTKNFHESDWTDQEVGYALARGVPLIAVKLGRDPYGFIGKFQALSCSWSEAPLELATLLTPQPRMLEAFVEAVPNCGNYNQANTISKLLEHIETLTEKQADRLASAFNGSTQLQGSFGFNGEREWSWGPGLARHLTRATGKKYTITKMAGSGWHIDRK